MLDRRCRFLFVNRAWEALTGLTCHEASQLVCRRPHPAGVEDSPLQILAHALTPPPEVLAGRVSRTRRLLPASDHWPEGPEGVAQEGPCPTGPRWWDIEFLPLHQKGKTGGALILGRILPLPETAFPRFPLPERLEALRLSQWQRHQIQVYHFPFNHLAQEGSALPAGFPFGSTPVMRRVLDQVQLASQLTLPVTIVGEPGTGKRSLAKILHSLEDPQQAQRTGVSERSSTVAFAALDCARLPALALDHLLFGERGKFQRSALRTVYLDEVAALPSHLQLRLCTCLGATSSPYPRIVAGTTTPLEQAVQQGRLLPELACVLGTLTIALPPLRERQEELPVLVAYLLARLQRDKDRPVLGLTPAAWEIVHGHHWPGNFCELFDTLRQARQRTLASPERTHIDRDDFPLVLRVQDEPTTPVNQALDLGQVLAEVETRLIRRALAQARGNRTRAAGLLSVSRAHLLRRLEVLGIEEDVPEEAQAQGQPAPERPPPTEGSSQPTTASEQVEVPLEGGISCRQVLLRGLEGRLAQMVQKQAEQQRWVVREVKSMRTCLRLLSQGGSQVVVLRVGRDLHKEMQFLQHVAWAFPTTPVVVVSSWGTRTGQESETPPGTESSSPGFEGTELAHSPQLASLAWDLGASYVLFPPLAYDLLPAILTQLMMAPSAVQPHGTLAAR